MKFLHTSDLHIGKRLHEQSLIGEQEFMLGQLIDIINERKIDALLIAGDVYDRSVPSLDAVNLFDDFLTRLAELNVKVFLIAGNHDSADRLDFGANIMGKQDVYISGRELKKIKITDEYGDLNVWLLPFNRNQVIETRLNNADINGDERNIVLAHQFVISSAGATEVGGSEIKMVGGVDVISAEHFKGFDYVALGHIHKPQAVGSEMIRYSGSPYPYSFDECGTEKGVVIIDAKSKGDIEISKLLLIPNRNIYRISCKLAQLENQDVPRDSYVEITLNDDEPVVDAIEKVRKIYPNTLKLVIDNKYSRASGAAHTLEVDDIKLKTPIELFAGFFKEMCGVELNEGQRRIVNNAMEGDGLNETD